MRLLIVLFLIAASAAALRFSLHAGQVPDDTWYAAEIRAAANRHGIDPQLVRALIWRESRFRARAEGDSGEIGLMQLLPKGAVAEYARVHRTRPFSRRELLNVHNNLEVGCWYLGVALRRWKNHDDCVERALVQYNAGEGMAKAWCRVPPKGRADPVPVFVRKYVDAIMSRYYGYKKKR